MKNVFLSLLCLFFINSVFAQTNYSSLTDWQAAINADATLSDCAQEDFSTAGDFKAAPLQLNGFTLERSAGTNTLLNEVTGGQASIFVEKDEPVEVKLTFTQPLATGFIADFIGVAGGEVLMLVYDSDMGMMASFDFTGMDNGTFGFLNAQNTPVSCIVFKALNSNGGVSGEGFHMDNVRIACGSPAVATAPIPTMSQWGLLVFGLLIMNLSVFFIQRRELI